MRKCLTDLLLKAFCCFHNIRSDKYCICFTSGHSKHLWRKHHVVVDNCWKHFFEICGEHKTSSESTAVRNVGLVSLLYVRMSQWFTWHQKDFWRNTGVGLHWNGYSIAGEQITSCQQEPIINSSARGSGTWFSTWCRFSCVFQQILSAD